jgi:hypothetical protein
MEIEGLRLRGKQYIANATKYYTTVLLFEKLTEKPT